MESILAGVAKVNITPPIGCLMGGYAFRDHGCESIRDELWTRAMYISCGETEVAIVGSDICGLTKESVDRIRSKVKAKTGIPEENIFLNATHNHSGPAYRNTEDELTYRNLLTIEDKIVGAITWAKASREEALVGWGKEEVLCGVNRRERRGDKIVIGVNPQGPVYPWVDILKVTRPDGSLLGTLFSHPCHANVMSGYEITGDFTGVAQSFIEDNTKGVAIFLQGCCGNIAPAIRRSFEHMELIGTRLGAAVVKGLTEIQTLQSPMTLRAMEHCIHLPLEASEEKELDVLGLPLKIQAIALGDWAILGIPAEVCIELSQAIQNASKFNSTIVAGYTNGAWGYFPPKELFADGGYEVEARCRYKGHRITQDSGDLLIYEALKLLSELS